MQQRSLFDVPIQADVPATSQPTVPYVRGSETSRAAAASIASVAQVARDRVSAYIAGQGVYGATDQEIAAGLAMLSDSARARRCELRDRGDIVDSGRRRPTPSGRAATVWIVAAISREMPVGGSSRPPPAKWCPTAIVRG
jgi:hypothetical protein